MPQRAIRRRTMIRIFRRSPCRNHMGRQNVEATRQGRPDGRTCHCQGPGGRSRLELLDGDELTRAAMAAGERASLGSKEPTS